MMIENPVDHLHGGGELVVLRGQYQVKDLYRMWDEMNQSIFFIESEDVAVRTFPYHYLRNRTWSNLRSARAK